VLLTIIVGSSLSKKTSYTDENLKSGRPDHKPNVLPDVFLDVRGVAVPEFFLNKSTFVINSKELGFPV
jgi:hypothetical protein